MRWNMCLITKKYFANNVELYLQIRQTTFESSQSKNHQYDKPQQRPKELIYPKIS